MSHSTPSKPSNPAPSKTTRPAPAYSAPPPPSSQSPGIIDDHDYEPVTVGSALTEPDCHDEAERATLPYRPAQRAAMNVGSGRSPKRAFSENLKTSPPRGERERSPSTPLKFEQKQTLPTVHENTLPQQKQGGRLLIPPKPTSPPPSPPTNVFSPPGIKPKTQPQPQPLSDDIYSFDRLSKSPDLEVTQPKLPKKQRKSSRQYTDVGSQSQNSPPREPDDGIYGFDKLDQSAATRSPVIPPKQRKAKPQPMEVMEPDPGVYGFDTLEPPAQNSHPQNDQLKAIPQHMEPTGVMEPDPGVYGFDTLEPPAQNSHPQSDQHKAIPQHMEPTGVMEPDPGVYGFDTLEPPQQNSQNVPPAQDNVYFDQLFTGAQEEPVPEPDNVYFDHLVTGKVR